MANKEHVTILKQGVEVWNRWREQNPTIQPGLSEANLFGFNLNEADLRWVNIPGAKRFVLDHSRGNIFGLEPNREKLFGFNLSEADLRRVNLRMADLRKADLRMADLRKADLRMANLRRANLRRADLTEADLSEADLRMADLRMIDFRRANLSKADLSEANLTETMYGYTNFGDVDLSQVKGLETAKHFGPSYIDIQTIYRSGGNIPEAFLRGAGIPDNFITFMKLLTKPAFDFYSCFISHSSKDRDFVERLYADLQSNRVRCWYAPEDLKIGEPFLLGIDQGIRLHDKLLLVLSENSVGSGWVQHEVLSAMAKEQGKAPKVLFPIRLDNTVMETDVSWANMIRQSRHIGDFTQWKDHDSYKKAFDRLLRDLKGKS